MGNFIVSVSFSNQWFCGWLWWSSFDKEDNRADEFLLEDAALRDEFEGEDIFNLQGTDTGIYSELKRQNCFIFFKFRAFV